MLDVPALGSRCRVWPMPGRRVQNGPRPVDAMGGGSFYPKSGRVVEITTFELEQLKCGDLLLHPPPCEKHDHGDDGQDECKHCGRDVKAAQKYDVDFTDGVKAAEAALKAGLPEHPLEKHRRLLREREEKQAARDKAAEPASAPAQK